MRERLPLSAPHIANNPFRDKDKIDELAQAVGVFIAESKRNVEITDKLPWQTLSASC